MVNAAVATFCSERLTLRSPPTVLPTEKNVMTPPYTTNKQEDPLPLGPRPSHNHQTRSRMYVIGKRPASKSIA